MKTNLKILIVALAVFIIGVNVPIQYFSFNHWFGGLNLGATITTISSTDLLSDFPTVFNTNITNLNTDKWEISNVVATTSISSITTLPNLASIGTITTGVWNGTTIAVNRGGTGSTTLSAFNVLIGSSTNAVDVVNGLGTSGQFLTSQGVGLPPHWTTSAIDEAGNYSWTGLHSFAATSTFNGYMGQTGSQIRDYGGVTPVGSILAYASSTAPSGWLSANGQAVSRTTYWALFQVIGTTYGVGDGSTTFNVPNLLGKQVLMASTTANMAQTGGESNHTLTVAELAAHTHSIDPATNNTGGAGAGNTAGGSSAAAQVTGSTGNDTPFNVLDPYLTTWYIIKY